MTALRLKLRIFVNETWTDINGKPRNHTDWRSCEIQGERAEALSQALTLPASQCSECGRGNPPRRLSGAVGVSRHVDADGIERRRTTIVVLRRVEVELPPRESGWW